MIRFGAIITILITSVHGIIIITTTLFIARGLSPHPTAWTKSEKTQKTFKLYNVIYFKEKRSDKLNGIINMNDNLMKISVNDGYLKVLELQIEGKKKMSVQEFINGYKSYNLSKLI